MNTYRKAFVVLLAALLGLSVTIAAGTASAANDGLILQTRLRGKSEVGGGDSAGRGSAFVFGLEDDSTTLCYVLSTRKTDGAPTAAHIHSGRKGTNGSVVVALTAPANGTSAGCVSEADEGVFADGVTAADILAHPRRYYVNIHSAAYPSGALRGQLRPAR